MVKYCWNNLVIWSHCFWETTTIASHACEPHHDWLVISYWGIWRWIMTAVWPDSAIYWTLGNFSKPLATINLAKSLTFLGNFGKGVKIFHFSSEIMLGATVIDIWQFFTGHTDHEGHLNINSCIDDSLNQSFWINTNSLRHSNGQIQKLWHSFEGSLPFWAYFKDASNRAIWPQPPPRLCDQLMKLKVNQFFPKVA